MPAREPKEFEPALYTVSLTEGEIGFLAGLIQPRLVHSTVLGQALAKALWEKLERATNQVVADRERSIGGRIRKQFLRRGESVRPPGMIKGLVDAVKGEVVAAPAPEAAGGGESRVPAGVATSTPDPESGGGD